MKKVFSCCICLLILTSIALSQDEKIPTLIKHGKTINSFIPNGWKLIQNAGGDLNGDGLTDIAGVIELNKAFDISSGEEAPPRVLFIALQQPGNQYRLSIQTEKAILLADQGGVWGDPLDGLAIEKGTLLIYFFGGSNYRWSYSYRFRYQNGGWYLIGATLTSCYTPTGEGTTEDYNLLTGKMIISKTDAKGNTQDKTVNRGKRQLLNLQDFDAASEEKQF